MLLLPFKHTGFLMKNLILCLGIALLPFGAGGCFFTTQSLNCGKLLQPGSSRLDLGVGPRTFIDRWQEYRSQQELDSILTRYPQYQYVWELPESLQYTYRDTRVAMKAWSLGYRLGIMANYPLGKGLEIGWKVEGPVSLDSGGVAVSMEFDARAGFKSLVLGRGLLHQNIGAGWLIGQWVDNSWYGEYAVGWEYKRLILYANYRGILSGTNFLSSPNGPMEYANDGFGLGRFRPSRRSWNNRVCLGSRWHLGDWIIIPNDVTLEAASLFPHYQASGGFPVLLSLGLQWEFK
jgi:hypothetical protein